MIALWPDGPLWHLARHLPWLTRPVIDFTELCVFLTVVLGLVVWCRPEGPRAVMAFGIGLIGAVVLCKSMAASFSVARPFVAFHFRPLYPHATDSSFPSTTVAYFAAGTPPAWKVSGRLGRLMAAITLEVAIGCVYVGVHYGTDVVAGALIGAGCSLAAWWALGRPRAVALTDRLDATLASFWLRPSRPGQPARPNAPAPLEPTESIDA